MKNLLLWPRMLAAALVLALVPALANAQTIASRVQAPAGYAPIDAPCVAQANGTCVPVSATMPLPTAGPSSGAATSTPLSVTVSTTGPQTIGPMTPQLAREVWGTLSATGATGTIQILRSTDGGATKQALTQAGYIGSNTVLSGSTSPAVAYSWTLSSFTGLIINEPLFTPTDAATYFVVVNLTGGSVSGRLGQ